MIKASIIIALVCTAGIMLYALINRNNKTRLYEIAKEREPFNLNAFKAAAKLNFVSDELISAVIKHLLIFVKISDFAFYADDDLRHLLKISNIEIKDLLTDVCLELNLVQPLIEDIKKYESRKGKLTSVGDLIRFMDYWGKKG